MTVISDQDDGGFDMPEQTTEDRWKFGLVALVVGVVSLLTAVLVVGRLWPDEASRAGVLASIVGAISAIVGAYFGIQIGGAEAKSAKQQAAAANDRAEQAESQKTQALQANAALLARPNEAPAVLEQFRIP